MTDTRQVLEEALREALQAALEWIDAIPDEVVASLPTMPGFDRDYVDNLITQAARRAKEAGDE